MMTNVPNMTAQLIVQGDRKGLRAWLAENHFGEYVLPRQNRALWIDEPWGDLYQIVQLVPGVFSVYRHVRQQ